MADNKFSKNTDSDYKLHAIAYLKDLKYLDYELIDDDVREKANEKYKEEIQEKENQKAAEKQEEHLYIVDPELVDAKIDCTDGMIDKIFNEDDDAVKLKALPKFPEIFQTFESNIDDPTQKYQSEMKNLNRQKKNTVLYCEQVLRDAEREAEKESIKLIEAFKSKRKHRFREIQNIGDNADYDTYEDELMLDINKLEDDLMGVEMKLQDTLT